MTSVKSGTSFIAVNWWNPRRALPVGWVQRKTRNAISQKSSKKFIWEVFHRNFFMARKAFYICANFYFFNFPHNTISDKRWWKRFSHFTSEVNQKSGRNSISPPNPQSVWCIKLHNIGDRDSIKRNVNEPSHSCVNLVKRHRHVKEGTSVAVEWQKSYLMMMTCCEITRLKHVNVTHQDGEESSRQRRNGWIIRRWVIKTRNTFHVSPFLDHARRCAVETSDGDETL